VTFRQLNLRLQTIALSLNSFSEMLLSWKKPAKCFCHFLRAKIEQPNLRDQGKMNFKAKLLGIAKKHYV
jgi:hypothetical protein